MLALHTQSIATNLTPSSLTFSKPISKARFSPLRLNPFRRSPPRCSLSAVSDPPDAQAVKSNKPYPAEVSRTIMELSSVGTLSTLTQEGWPLSVGIRFAVDPQGTPVLCLNASNGHFAVDKRSSLHVELEQSGLRTPQCTIQGSLEKPEDRILLKRLNSVWENRFGSEVDEDLIYIVAVDKVLQMEDFMEGGAWVNSSDYRLASPDPLRDFAEKLVSEINTNNMEDVLRFCNIYIDLDFQVSEAKIIWVDRLGFDMRISSPVNGVFEARIPFPREVTNEKGARSSFNCMSQLAWEVEKNYVVPDFDKVRQLKQLTQGANVCF